jgi:hypothetical protein
MSTLLGDDITTWSLTRISVLSPGLSGLYGFRKRATKRGDVGEFDSNGSCVDGLLPLNMLRESLPVRLACLLSMPRVPQCADVGLLQGYCHSLILLVLSSIFSDAPHLKCPSVQVLGVKLCGRAEAGLGLNESKEVR